MTYLTLRKQMARRPTLRSLARHATLSALALRTRPDPIPSLRALYCHYVFDDQMKDFERKIKYLSSIGRFISSDELYKIVTENITINETLFHISFDDGFRNIVKNALPVLVEYGVPGTFFVPTAYISADEEAVRHYCRNVTRYPGAIEMAGWDDLGHAHEQGMTIGSHTRTHARFSEISGSEERMRDEIARSKDDIEHRLGVPCDYISWPFGRKLDADASSLRFARSANYRACFGAYRGSIRPRETDRFSIPRHHFEVEWPMSHFKYFAHGNRE